MASEEFIAGHFERLLARFTQLQARVDLLEADQIYRPRNAAATNQETHQENPIDQFSNVTNTPFVTARNAAGAKTVRRQSNIFNLNSDHEDDLEATQPANITMSLQIYTVPEERKVNPSLVDSLIPAWYKQQKV